MKRFMFVALPFVVSSFLVTGCTQKSPPSAVASVSPSSAPTVTFGGQWRATAESVFKPLPQAAPPSSALVDLGRMLYYDPRLSKSGTISCNSCHALDRYGVDGEPTSPGFEGKRGNRNSPTVYHAFLHHTQFWDGRAKTVEEQAMGPVLNPVEMGLENEAAVTKILEKVPEYRKRFAEVFPDDPKPLTLELQQQRSELLSGV